MTQQKIYLIGHREEENRMKTLGLPNFEPIVYGVDYYKIGIAKEPSQRVSQLSAGTPHVLELVTTVKSDDAKQVETDLHSLKDMKRKRGEWFYLSDEFVNSMKELDFLSAESLNSVRKICGYSNQEDESFAEMVYTIRNVDPSIERISQKAISTDSGGM